MKLRFYRQSLPTPVQHADLRWRMWDTYLNHTGDSGTEIWLAVRHLALLARSLGPALYERSR